MCVTFFFYNLKHLFNRCSVFLVYNIQKIPDCIISILIIQEYITKWIGTLFDYEICGWPCNIVSARVRWINGILSHFLAGLPRVGINFNSSPRAMGRLVKQASALTRGMGTPNPVTAATVSRGAGRDCIRPDQRDHGNSLADVCLSGRLT